jgi:hypothetical protein
MFLTRNTTLQIALGSYSNKYFNFERNSQIDSYHLSKFIGGVEPG